MRKRANGGVMRMSALAACAALALCAVAAARFLDGGRSAEPPVSRGSVSVAADAVPPVPPAEPPRRFLDDGRPEKKCADDRIDVDLGAMKLTLFENGVPVRALDVKTKGRPLSWLRTATGEFSVLGTEDIHFSKIGKVWTPYSVRYFGDYFIHGWPYQEDGGQVATTYSGGCVRLADDDARIVYEFARAGMPVSVREPDDLSGVGALEKAAGTAAPVVPARSYAVVDLSTGELLAGNGVDEKTPASGVVKLMTALAAHEGIFLGRTATTTDAFPFRDVPALAAGAGTGLLGLDLLYPMLMASSNDAARLVASLVGEGYLVSLMNAKAEAIGMDATRFADVTGMSERNVSTARDAARLLKHVYFRRGFLLAIANGKRMRMAGLPETGRTIDLARVPQENALAGDGGLAGAKSGGTRAAGEAFAGVWEFGAEGARVPVGIVVLGSPDAGKDAAALRDWAESAYRAVPRTEANDQKTP